MEELALLEEALGVRFTDPTLLEKALVHRSYLNENPDFPLSHNERLEFLGDAILGLVVAERLYSLSPPLSEGRMTQLRSALVRQETLAAVARSLGLGQKLRLGKGEEASGGRARPSNLARSLEAVVGAVLLDQGKERAREVVWRLLEKEWQRATSGEVVPNYKSELQEYLQAKGMPRPHYQVSDEMGPEHARSFTVEAWIGNKVRGRGQGGSKKQAEAEAAHQALEAMANLGGAEG